MHGKTLALSSIAVVAIGSMVFATPPVQRYLSPQGIGDNVYDPSLDPAIGSVFPVPRKDAFDRPIIAANRMIVVIAGNCTSCSLHAIDPRQIVPDPKEVYLFAYQTQLKDLQPWMRLLPSNVRILNDEDATMKKAANSAWQPRYVVLDADQRVLDLSKDDAGVPEYVHLRRRA